MIERDKENPPDHFDSTKPARDSESFLLFTWLGTIFFFICNCAGASAGKWGASQPIIGVFLLLAILSLVGGLIASLAGMKNGGSGSVGLLIGMLINATILAVYSILIVRAIMNH